MQTPPSLFLSHGGPNIVIDESEARSFLQSLERLLGRPKAIVIASAHFETTGATVVTDPAPGMIYDFGGFPDELYRMRYPAPGDPELANIVAELLKGNGIECRRMDRRGFDHGSWTPLLLAYPSADIPVVQLSIDPGRDARYHYELGLALESLRADGVAIIGSGHITHNLRAVFDVFRGGKPADPKLAHKVEAFTEWFVRRFAEGDTETILDWRSHAPFVADNHPADEHLMPLFFAYGAGGKDAPARRVHASRQFGFFAFDCWMFGEASA